MRGRLLWFALPLILVATGVLAVWLADEAARRISAEAAMERDRTVEEQLERLRTNGPVEGGELSPTEHVQLVIGTPALGSELEQVSSDRLADDAVVWPWTDGVWVHTTTVTTPVGVIEVASISDVAPVRADVLRRWTVIGASVATLLALVAAATYPLSRWATRPVRRLGAAAEALAAGEIDVRAEVGRGAPELQEVAGHFNHIATRLGDGIHRERVFIANASHHLGNLMTPLRLRVESLDVGDDRGAEALTEVSRLEDVVEQLLQLNRAEEHELEPVLLDVAAAVDGCLHTWEPATEALGIELHREGRDAAFAVAPPGAIEEIVDNLLDNAVKYGDGTPITVRVLRGLDNVRLVVADRGPGMTPDDIAHAHGRFWRGPDHQNLPGSGLGLSIVDALAQRCGGRFELRAPSGGGLEATLALPRANA
ncbi:MAG: HAMP domain-containing sensor histidine kinase [Actinomycetota bacterium]